MADAPNGNGVGHLIEARFILTVLLILLAGIYDVAVTFWKPIEDPAIIGTILGVLNTGGFMSAVGYWFGTTTASKAKDETIAAQAATLKQNGN